AAPATPAAPAAPPAPISPDQRKAERDRAAADLSAKLLAEQTAESNHLAEAQRAAWEEKLRELELRQYADHVAGVEAIRTRLEREHREAERAFTADQDRALAAERARLAGVQRAELDRLAQELVFAQSPRRQRLVEQLTLDQDLERRQAEAQIRDRLARAPGSFDPNAAWNSLLAHQAATRDNALRQLDGDLAAERQRVEAEARDRLEREARAEEQRFLVRQQDERVAFLQHLAAERDAHRRAAEQELADRQRQERERVERETATGQEVVRTVSKRFVDHRLDLAHDAGLREWLPPGTRHHGAFADDATAAKWADDAYPGLAAVNRKPFEAGVPGHNVNCTNCVIATHETLHGRPVAAPPLPGPAPGSYLEQTFNANFRVVPNYHHVVDHLAAEPGRHVGVGITRTDGSGHVFNAWNDGRGITFFDAQSHRPAKLERTAAKIELIPLPNLPGLPNLPPTTAPTAAPTGTPAGATPPIPVPAWTPPATRAP
ncbi:hypothetical protein J7S33_19165, partial [Saccharothrix algeriensis]